MGRSKLHAVTACFALCAVAAAGATAQSRMDTSRGETRQRLTIAATFETARAMTDEQGNTVFASPDGKCYVIMLIRGDIARDGIVATLVGGDLSSLDRAVKPAVIAEFFTRGLRPTDVPAEAGFLPLIHPGENPPRWLDERHVALLWEDAQEVRQIVSVNVETREIRFLTHHPTSTLDFNVSRRGDLIYSAMAADGRPRSRALIQSGFAVRSLDLMTLLTGDVSDTSMFDRLASSEYFVIRPGSDEAKKIAVPHDAINRASLRQTSPTFSPDGRWAIVRHTAADVPAAWARYELGARWQVSVSTHATDPLAPGARAITQYYLVDVIRAQARPLWDAPLWSGRKSLAWSPNSKSVAVGPVVLPLPQTDEASVSELAVAEVDVASGRYWRLPLSADFARSLRSLHWLSDRRIEARFNDGSPRFFRKLHEAWRLDGSPAQAHPPTNSAAVRIELRQDMNTPPVFYAIDNATGQERLLLDPNPQLQNYSLGRVEMVRWRDPENQPWTARLYYPVSYEPGQRYPLVVQTYGAPGETEFSLGGNRPGTGPGWGTRIAQPLANRGIMVLQVGGPDGIGVSTVGAASLAMQAAGRESGIGYLIDRGLVDGTRVGIEALSSTGRQVEHSLAFSDFPYAAAVINDHGDNNYFQSMAQMVPAKSFPELVPFGPAGMKGFLESSPAWNAERIRTPVQLIINGPGHDAVLFSWEMFARLRYLKKPVELYVAPDVQRGNHLLQNPRQSMTVQQRGLDWWCFWLKGEEDSTSAKGEQYAQWRQLRSLRDADLQKPRPPKLTWTAIPNASAPE